MCVARGFRRAGGLSEQAAGRWQRARGRAWRVNCGFGWAARDGMGRVRCGDGLAGAPSRGTLGARWFALRELVVVSAATPPALQPVDLGIGARVGWGAFKNMTWGARMLTCWEYLQNTDKAHAHEAIQQVPTLICMHHGRAGSLIHRSSIAQHVPLCLASR